LQDRNYVSIIIFSVKNKVGIPCAGNPRIPGNLA
jgi:hypothetical protein